MKPKANGTAPRVNRAFRSSANSRARRSSSPRKAARARCFPDQALSQGSDVRETKSERNRTSGQPRLPELGQQPSPSFLFAAEGGPGPGVSRIKPFLRDLTFVKPKANGTAPRVNRAFRSSANSRARRSSSPRKAARARCFPDDQKRTEPHLGWRAFRSSLSQGSDVRETKSERNRTSGQPRLPELGQQPSPSFLFAAEGGPGPGVSRIPVNPLNQFRLGRFRALMSFDMLVEGFTKSKIRAGRGPGSHKGGYGIA